MIRVPTHRSPTHPGKMLREEFLHPLGLTQQALATAIDVPFQRVNELVNERRGLTLDTALRLGRFFGNSPIFWLNLQLRMELFHAQRVGAKKLLAINPHARSAGVYGQRLVKKSRVERQRTPTNHFLLKPRERVQA